MDLVSEAFEPSRLTPELILRAYREGFFPMACGDGDMRWFSPDPRGIIPLDAFHLPHGFRRRLPRLDFACRVNTAFAEVITGCADRPQTWIDRAIIAAYTELHRRGAAHCVEAWRGGELVGGLYGVQLGGAFFGESMFSRVEEASKFALMHLVNILRDRGFALLDCQWLSDHLRRFGAVEIRRPEYLRRLRDAAGLTPRFADPPRAPAAADATPPHHPQTTSSAGPPGAPPRPS